MEAGGGGKTRGVNKGGELNNVIYLMIHLICEDFIILSEQIFSIFHKSGWTSVYNLKIIKIFLRNYLRVFIEEQD